MKHHLAPTTLMALSILAVAQAHAAAPDAEQRGLNELRNTVINLLQGLVEKGVLTRDQAQAMVESAQKKAATDADALAKAEEGACMFLVDLPDPAIRIEHVPNTIDSSMPGGHATIRIDNLRVPADQMLGESGEGFKYAQIRLAPARLSHCMRWHGAATRAQEIATDYACRRVFPAKPPCGLWSCWSRPSAPWTPRCSGVHVPSTVGVT